MRGAYVWMIWMTFLAIFESFSMFRGLVYIFLFMGKM